MDVLLIFTALHSVDRGFWWRTEHQKAAFAMAHIEIERFAFRPGVSCGIFVEDNFGAGQL